MTTRRLVEALLFAALVPVGLIGVQSWRASSEPAPPRIAASVIHAARPQLGRSTPRRAMVATAPPVDVEAPALPDDPMHRATPTLHGRPPADPVGAEPQRVAWVTPARPARPIQSEEPRGPRAGGAGLPGSSTGASGSSGTVAGASSLAVVQFVGVMQDQTLLARDEFVADFVRQLKITVQWKVAGNHAQRLELFTPDGSLYRRIATDFTGVGVASALTPVETLLPVGGSWITEHSLFGTWRVDVYLDGQPATSATFGLIR